MSGDDFTKVADVIVPELFTPYVVEQSTAVNAFFQSGAVQAVPGLNFSDRGGTTLHLPFWKALGERAQLLDDNQNLEVRQVRTGQDLAVQHMRALVYGATDLAAALAGSDPMRVVGDSIAGNWSEEFNHILLASLIGATGAMAAESPSMNALDISGLSGDAGKFTGESFIDALQTLGDAKGKIVAVAVHSITDAAMAKADLIETVRDSDGNIVTRTFMGKTVIVDDILTAASGGAYTSFLFGAGAIGFAEGTPKVPTEIERNALINGGQEYLVSRRHFAMHPRGIAWTPGSGVPALETPSDAELVDPTNWTRVYDPKNIRIVSFTHN